MDGMTACVGCGVPIRERKVAGKQVVACSPECRAARDKAKKRESYERNREEVIARARQWRLENPERKREADRLYREENEEALRKRKRQYHLANPEQGRERSRAWYAANREHIRAEWSTSQTEGDRAAARERMRRWAEANPERRMENVRRWAANNPEKVAIVRHRRRARLNGIPADSVTVTDLMIAQDFLCYLCDEPMDPELKKPHTLSPSIDHIVPIARGGTSLRENLAAAHLGCNCAKGAKLLDSA